MLSNPRLCRHAHRIFIWNCFYVLKSRQVHLWHRLLCLSSWKTHREWSWLFSTRWLSRSLPTWVLVAKGRRFFAATNLLIFYSSCWRLSLWVIWGKWWHKMANILRWSEFFCFHVTPDPLQLSISMQKQTKHKNSSRLCHQKLCIVLYVIRATNLFHVLWLKHSLMRCDQHHFTLDLIRKFSLFFPLRMWEKLCTSLWIFYPATSASLKENLVKNLITYPCCSTLTCR